MFHSHARIRGQVTFGRYFVSCLLLSQVNTLRALDRKTKGLEEIATRGYGAVELCERPPCAVDDAPDVRMRGRSQNPSAPCALCTGFARGYVLAVAGSGGPLHSRSASRKGTDRDVALPSSEPPGRAWGCAVDLWTAAPGNAATPRIAFARVCPCARPPTRPTAPGARASSPSQSKLRLDFGGERPSVADRSVPRRDAA